MKKGFVLVVITIFLFGCSPSEAQIQDAINQTESALPTITPTVTITPEPTITPIRESTSTPEPTSTPDYVVLKHVDYSDIYNLFDETGMFCNPREIDNDGSYTQECFGTMSDGTIQGIIAGFSEDSVSLFFFMVVPYVGSEITDYCKKTLSDLLDFGGSSNDMKSWVVDNIEEIVEGQEEPITKQFTNVRLELSGGSGVVSLMVIAIP